MKHLYQKYKLAIPALLYGMVYLTWFAALESSITVNTPFQLIHMKIDDYIPFCEYFIVPYLLWFFYVPAVLIYLFFKDRDDYCRNGIFLAAGMTVFLLISTFWPNGHHLRPAVMPDGNFFARLTASLYRTDTPTNLWPSIHVYNSLAAHFAILCNRKLCEKKWVRYGSAILCTSIILATMFLKQHSMFDVLTAFVMAAVMYGVVYYFDIVTLWKFRKYRTAQRARKRRVGLS